MFYRTQTRRSFSYHCGNEQAKEKLNGHDWNAPLPPIEEVEPTGPGPELEHNPEPKSEDREDGESNAGAESGDREGDQDCNDGAGEEGKNKI